MHGICLAATTKTRGFQQGDNVTFQDRDGRNITGVVVRINQRTATVGTGDGGKWRVPFHMLRPARHLSHGDFKPSIGALRPRSPC